jgi:hypothetical protein
MRPVKNKRRIDPRYFLNETADRDDLVAEEANLKDPWSVGGKFFSRTDNYSVGVANAKVEEVAAAMAKNLTSDFARKVAYSNSCSGEGIILEIINMVGNAIRSKGAEWFGYNDALNFMTKGKKVGRTPGVRTENVTPTVFVDNVKELVKQIQAVRRTAVQRGEAPTKEQLGCAGSDAGKPIPEDFFADKYGPNQKNLLEEMFKDILGGEDPRTKERYGGIAHTMKSGKYGKFKDAAYDPDIQENKS